jgi:hypothetical protein
MSWVPRYGKWGGPGYSGGRRRKHISRHDKTLEEPIDKWDEAFMEHDFGYEVKEFLKADKQLVKILEHEDPRAFTYPWFAKHLFRAMTLAREIGLLDPGVESNPGPPKQRLRERMAGRPWTTIEGDHQQQTPMYPKPTLARTVTMSNSTGYPNPWTQGFPGKRDVVSKLDTTLALVVDEAQPFLIVNNGTNYGIQPTIDRPTAFDVHLVLVMTCDPLSQNTQFRFELALNYNTVSTRTQDMFATNNFYSVDIPFRVYIQPGDVISLFMHQFPVGGAASITGTATTCRVTLERVGNAIGSAVRGVWLPMPSELLTRPTGFQPEQPEVLAHWVPDVELPAKEVPDDPWAVEPVQPPDSEPDDSDEDLSDFFAPEPEVLIYSDDDEETIDNKTRAAWNEVYADLKRRRERRRRHKTLQKKGTNLEPTGM